MAFLSASQSELLLALIEGSAQGEPWEGMLHTLVRQSGADCALLLIAPLAGEPPRQVRSIHAPGPRITNPDPARLAALGLSPSAPLRTGRIYALEEILDFSAPEVLARQRAMLAEMGIAHGRALRLGSGGAGEALLLMAREREDFPASLAATLSNLAPHLTAALRLDSELVRLQLQASMAEEALARLGIGQIAFDPLGRIVAIDPVARQALGFGMPLPAQSMPRLQLPAETALELERACATVVGSGVGEAILLDPRRALWLVLRRADQHGATVIGTLRLPRDKDPQSAVGMLAAVHGLSRREAALAEAMSRGESIVEAGARLGLTRETARNYSKRIYAKTGTTGQADLVRLILTGLAPLG